MNGLGEMAEGWYPDPFGRHELRHYDGGWTDSVMTNGRRRQDVPGGQPGVPTLECPPEEIRRVVAAAGAPADGPGDANLLAQAVLVFSTRWPRGSTEFAVFTGGGHQVGAIREVGQTWANHLSRVGHISLPFLLGRNLQLVDMAGSPVVVVKRPLNITASVVRAQYLIKDGRGRPLGEVAQSFTAQFEVTWGEGSGASIKQKGWSGTFTVGTASTDPIARITRSRASGTLHYVLDLVEAPEDRLRRLLLAAPAVIDVTRRHVDTMAD